jgi:hypothetical protein
MDPLAMDVAVLAAATKFPPPDDPDDPNSNFTLTVAQARPLRATLSALVDYIEVEYARCGKKTTP